MDEIALNLPFLIAGLIIFIGFLGTLFFQKTRIPDVLFLIAIGALIGPVAGWIEASQLEKITPYFGRLALIIILFEGGMHLSFDSIIKYFIGGIGLSIGTFAFSVFALYLIGTQVIGISVLNSLILGCIVGCTSPAIILPLITKMNSREETRSIISIESVLTEIFALIGVLVLIDISLMGQIQASKILNSLVGSFSIAIVAGVLFGLVWMKALESVKISALSYMTTMAAVLVLFGLVEMSKGSGAVAAFTFGLVLRNGTRFLRVFDTSKTFTLNGKIEEFHGEFTFFVRTYFFVYMGLLISRDLFRHTEILRDALLISGSLIIVRYLFVWILCAVYKPMRAERFTFFTMLPRGLASAVVASLPAAFKIPGTENFVTYTILVILLSNIFMVLGVFTVERRALKNNGNGNGNSVT
ncbi:MAG: cation:proton antiporter [Planctomycetes bacterium]|nr:cation:proton antiporter [Planctomycetota bacterium]